MQGIGQAFFAATLLTIAGFVNIIYGFGALDGVDARAALVAHSSRRLLGGC